MLNVDQRTLNFEVYSPSPDSSGILLCNAMEQKIERIAGIAPKNEPATNNSAHGSIPTD